LPATLCHMFKSRFCMFWTELLASTIPDTDCFHEFHEKY
jgi:hypothetical protein